MVSNAAFERRQTVTQAASVASNPYADQHQHVLPR